jgi:4-hydroxybenzoate polyprenyltransferase
LAAAWSADLSRLFYAPVVLAGLHLAWQAARVRTDDPRRALALFKSNGLTGLLIFAAFVLGAFG